VTLDDGGMRLQLGAKPFLFPLLDRFGFGHTTEMGNRRGSDSWFLCCSLRQCVSSFVSFDVLMSRGPEYLDVVVSRVVEESEC